MRQSTARVPLRDPKGESSACVESAELRRLGRPTTDSSGTNPLFFDPLHRIVADSCLLGLFLIRSPDLHAIHESKDLGASCDPYPVEIFAIVNSHSAISRRFSEYVWLSQRYRSQARPNDTRKSQSPGANAGCFAPHAPSFPHMRRPLLTDGNQFDRTIAQMRFVRALSHPTSLIRINMTECTRCLVVMPQRMDG
jgi:hypothetical protein